MKSIMIGFLSLVFTLNVSASFSQSDLEAAAAKYLNIADLEIYTVESVLVSSDPLKYEVSFEYDEEEFEDGWLTVFSYKCDGILTIANSQMNLQFLNCEEEEPTLWDEF